MWSPGLHPRQGGGRFGQANNPHADTGKKDAQLKGQLRDKANEFRKQAQFLKGQLHSIRIEIESLRKSSHHMAITHTSTAAKARKPSKVAKTVTKNAKSAASKTARSKPSSSVSSQASIAKRIANLQGKAVMIRGQIDALDKRANQLDAQAAKL